MKMMLAILGALAISSTTFAASQDKSAETLQDLLKIGIKATPANGKIRVAIQDADCGESLQTGEVSCSGIDLGVPGGKAFELKGQQASSMMVALYRSGASGDEGMGKLWMSAKLLECNQDSAKINGSGKVRCSATNE